MNTNNIIIEVNPNITPDQLWDFYIRNDICEIGFGKEIAVKPLYNSNLIIGAFYEDKLVGIARALFDGVSAAIMEFCLEIELQGPSLKYDNGSIIESDIFGIGKKMGDLLKSELKSMGASFINVYIIEDCEEEFHKSIGFKENVGHLVYVIDERPYVS